MSEDNNTYNKSVRIIRFSGKVAEWRIWSLKFLAYASVKGYKSILLGNDVIMSKQTFDAIDRNTDEGKELVATQEKLQKKNVEAYNALVLSLDDEVSLGAVETAITDEFPDGNAKQAWDNLLEIFEPKTRSNKVQLLREFTSSRLSDVNKNPDTWVDELLNISKRLKKAGVTKTDEDIIMHILGNLPKEYDTLVEILENDLDMSPEEMTLEKIRLRLRARYQRLQNDEANNNSTSENKDQALAAYKPFKGCCRNCGKIGHKASTCRVRTNNNNNNRNNRNNGTNNNLRNYNGNNTSCGKHSSNFAI